MRDTIDVAEEVRELGLILSRAFTDLVEQLNMLVVILDKIERNGIFVDVSGGEA